MKGSAFRLATMLLLPMSLILVSWSVGGRAQQPPAPGGGANPDVAAKAKSKIPILEGFPNRIQARLEQRRRSLSAVVPARPGFAPGFIISLTKRWKPGQTIKIAFRGGDKALHKDIDDTVSEWTKYANLKFDFGRNPTNGTYRAWKPTDTEFAADIRVSFNQPGFFSLVGNDSTNKNITKPGEESLNLEGFDVDRPTDWKAVALHEFGHAIGFEHEHQGSDACDFRFDDDPGYVATTDGFGQFVTDAHGKRPGLYTLLGGPPNNWPPAVVDFNLRKLPASNAFEQGPFDKHSIMKYFFPDFMFISGKNSDCYTDSEALVLSDQDKVGAAKVYPKSDTAIAADVDLRTKILEDFSKAKAMPAMMRQHFQESLEMIKIK